MFARNCQSGSEETPENPQKIHIHEIATCKRERERRVREGGRKREEREREESERGEGREREKLKTKILVNFY